MVDPKVPREDPACEPVDFDSDREGGDPPGLDCNNERINRVGGQQDDGALAPADRAILFGPDKARGIAMSRVFAPVSFQLVAIV